MVMASFTVTPNSISSSLLRLQSSVPSQISPLLPSYQQQLGGSCRRSRGSLVVTRGGPPGTSTYIFAFVFPLSLLAVTIFTAIRISDKLDKDFYEEMAVNQSILEAEDEDEDVSTPTNEEPPRPRTRNRPKREAEAPGR
ncbi:uncharacterized protein LOC112519495 [Cynara cardunculus var. scolymus]|uniref:High chlorophyll fluorescence 153 n=1 Tax=Cynara cardunculus var. scolymus TaxID=59895 RepID=A0A103Y1K3_CYNCS|nr:uncharacterized protein LOC112519495 [Cynara cardunculus var. scolymus]KVI00815.1 hypothetical protein Ccrd_020931 [Cynara cardunculus var. scolymus]